MQPFQEAIIRKTKELYHKPLKEATAKELYNAVSAAAMDRCYETWQKPVSGKVACYLSAEFLVGRLIHSNLLNLGLLEETESLLRDNGINPNVFEEVEDDALGNGGLGRLAACFLDSAATQNVPLYGYGIRYRYGLFKQHFAYGCQQEEADDWLSWGDPWSVRREDERVRIQFGDQAVWAVPYDMPVIGYGGKCVNTLRLWQAEALVPFDFHLFNDQKYDESVKQKNAAEAISAVLYPNDDTDAGKRLRLKQQYFFSSASLQSMLRAYRAAHGEDLSRFAEFYAVQLNDTHPTVSIPELLRLLMTEGSMEFEPAFQVVQKTFAYTNHTIMAEALEKWSLPLFQSVLPEVYPYVVMIQNRLSRELKAKGLQHDAWKYNILQDNLVHMARMAIYATHSTNGVAKIHTEIIKHSALPEWYQLYPERFNNKTNGVTQRRWLALCNRELARFISERIGTGWITDFSQIEKLKPYASDPASCRQFLQIKREKKNQLADYVYRKDRFGLNTNNLFDVQVKRLHEYKRQLLNAFSILDTYFGLKEGRIRDFTPTTYLFGAKAAPGYYRAKGIIKFINEVADLVNYDDAVNRKMQVVFVSNYNVSYAEKLITAADISEQISTAGTEASGTSNMKFMMNGALTLGTYDGANIEIVQNAGEENAFIFGARVEDLEEQKNYDPNVLYESQPRIRRVVDTLIDGTLNDGGDGWFRELYNSLLKGASWHKPDNYYLLLDFLPYCDARLEANRAYRDELTWAKKCLLNIAAAGPFTSDRTIAQYAKEIWSV